MTEEKNFYTVWTFTGGRMFNGDIKKMSIQDFYNKIYSCYSTESLFTHNHSVFDRKESLDKEDIAKLIEDGMYITAITKNTPMKEVLTMCKAGFSIGFMRYKDLQKLKKEIA